MTAQDEAGLRAAAHSAGTRMKGDGWSADDKRRLMAALAEDDVLRRDLVMMLMAEMATSERLSNVTPNGN